MSLRLLLILLCSGLSLSITRAQTTVPYNPGDTDASSYDSTANDLTLDIASGSATQSGALTGSGQVIKTGAGTVTLTGSNSYTGDTSVNGGVLAVDGPSGSITSTSFIYAGRTNNGTFNLTNGATATSGSYVIIGNDAGTTGFITVDGTDSQLSAGNNIDVGLFGNGSLTIGNGGTVYTPNLVYLAYDNGTTATLNLNSGGTLKLGDLVKGSGGTATVNFAGGTLESVGAFETPVDINLTNTSTIPFRSEMAAFPER